MMMNDNNTNIQKLTEINTFDTKQDQNNNYKGSKINISNGLTGSTNLEESKTSFNDNIQQEWTPESRIQMSTTLKLEIAYLWISIIFKTSIVDETECDGAAIGCLNFIFYSYLIIGILYFCSRDFISIVWEVFSFIVYIYAWVGFAEIDECPSIKWFIYLYLIPYTILFGFVAIIIITYFARFIQEKTKKKSIVLSKLEQIETRAQKLIQNSEIQL